MEHQPHLSKAIEEPTQSAITQTAADNAGSNDVESQLVKSLHRPSGSTLALPNAVETRPRATGNDAAIEIGQAYDRIHRIQASLAYIKIKNTNINHPGFSLILYEARHTYEQALSLYEGRDFEAAFEFASASRELSLVLSIILSRALRSDSLYPTLVPFQPENQITMCDSIRMREELYRVEDLLFFVHRVTENGTLPPADQTQILNIASCSKRLLKVAHQLLGFAEMQDAIDLIHAALVTAHAADHICKRWYAMQDINRFLPPQHSPITCVESSGRDCERDGISRTLDLEGRTNIAFSDLEGKTAGVNHGE